MDGAVTKRLTLIAGYSGQALERGVRNIRTGFQRVRATATRAGQAIGRALRTPLGMLGLGGGVYGLIRAFTGLIGAATTQEEIFRKLETVVELTGVSYGSVKKRIDAFLASMQATTRYGDTDLAPVLQMITQLSGSLEKGFEGVRVAADMTAAGLFDLNTSAKYVAQAMAGEVTMLGRYIPELKSSAGLITLNMTATEKWAIAKGLLNQKFGGMAQKDLDTYLGSINQLKNDVGDIVESIGDRFIPVLTDLAKRIREVIVPSVAARANYEKMRRAFDETIGSINPLVERFKELDRETRRSAEEQKEYNKLMEKLSSLVPGIVTAYGGYGRIMAINLPQLNEMIGYKRELLKIEKETMLLKLGKEIEGVRKKSEELNETYKTTAIRLALQRIATEKLKGAIGDNTNAIWKSTDKEKEFREHLEYTGEKLVEQKRKYIELREQIALYKDVLMRPEEIPPPSAGLPTPEISAPKQAELEFRTHINEGIEEGEILHVENMNQITLEGAQRHNEIIGWQYKLMGKLQLQSEEVRYRLAYAGQMAMAKMLQKGFAGEMSMRDAMWEAVLAGTTAMLAEEMRLMAYSWLKKGAAALFAEPWRAAGYFAGATMLMAGAGAMEAHFAQRREELYGGEGGFEAGGGGAGRAGSGGARTQYGTTVSAERMEMHISPSVSIVGDIIVIGDIGVEELKATLGQVSVESVQDALETGEIDIQKAVK